MNKKKLLILGANAETVALVKTAQQMGVFTIVTDNVKDAYAKRIADSAWDIDGLDIDALERMAAKEQVEGIIVGTADPLVSSYYTLCTRLNKPCYVTSKALEVFTNKKKLKKKCSEFGIKGVPEYSIEDIYKGNVIFPVLIKPVDGRSGKGMSVCYGVEEIEDAIVKAKQVSKCNQIIIERYMQCDDVFMYYTFCEGRFILSAMADRYTTKEQKGCAPVVLGATYPSKYLSLYMSTLHEKMCRLFSDLEIKDGVFLIQAFIENENFYVYDPGFRLQGAAPHILMENITHFDQKKMLINYALTGKTDIQEIEEKNDVLFKGKIAASQTVLLRKGKIGKIIGIKKISELSQIVSVTQRLEVDDEVNQVGTEQQVLVRFHMVCNSQRELESIVTLINEKVDAYDTEGSSMRLKGLFEV